MKINLAIPTAVESGAQPLATVTTDYYGTTRNAIVPDIGAVEDNMTPLNTAITSVSASPATGGCTAVSHVVTAVVIPGVNVVTTVMLNYSYNGTPGAGSPVAMTNPSGNTWAGIIPAATPTSAVVTWSVTATDATPATKTANGNSFQDNYLVAPVVVVSPNPVCGGANVLLLAGGLPSSAQPATSYCASTHASGCSGDNVSRVVLNTLDNTTGTACGGTSHYSYFNGGGAQTTTLNAASPTYTISVTFGLYGYVKVRCKQILER